MSDLAGFYKIHYRPIPGTDKAHKWPAVCVCVCGGKGAQVQLELTDTLCGIMQVMESTLSWSLLPLLHP